MGTEITSVVSFTGNGSKEEGYIFCAQKALDKMGQYLNKISIRPDMLISTGVYRENHMVEPALSAFFLDYLEQNTPSATEKQSVITFDLTKGACGLIQAFQLVDGFINANKVKYALVIGNISMHNKKDTDEATVFLLTATLNDSGFTIFYLKTYPEFMNKYSTWGYLNDGQVKLKINAEKDFDELCAYCLCQTLNEWVEKQDILLLNFDALVFINVQSNVVCEVLQSFNWRDVRLFIKRDEEDLMLLSKDQFHNPMRFDDFLNSDSILFISVGAGICTSLAVYQSKK
ncbi:beta-ketoacyl-[acyl-carrier-protein] synthase family protein [Carboxylicivirga linearis]|uniref:Beta-ketoacyl-[acyl-carrier-protein] synthase III N-terminal domain-containing protein n=1 Tax=Carboxylicivirga linearis TaxID=1628157 RepID=A0ABS5JUX8_9BACT|nr:hypothetical protein [Carboxylicivirga linearis]MBS2098274.1 hypothetical protein [Carboxylicivirga linearis]